MHSQHFFINARKDRLTRCLFKNYTTTTIYLLIWILLYHLLAWQQGVLFDFALPQQYATQGIETESLLRFDVRTGFMWYFVLTFCFFSIVNLLNKVPPVFSKVIKGHIDDEKERNTLVKNWNVFSKNFETTLNSKQAYLIGLIVSVIFSASLVLPYFQVLGEGFSSASCIYWTDPRVSSFFIYNTLFLSINYFIAGVILWKILIIAWYMNHTPSKLNLKLHPVHPDKKGGVAPFLNLAYALNLCAIAGGSYGLVYLLLMGGFSKPFIIFVTIYLIIGTFLFIYPLFGVHSAMEIEKKKILNKIESELELLSNKRDGFFTKGKKISDKYLSKWTALETTYKTVLDTTILPLNTKTIIRFIATFVIPSGFVILQIVLGKIL